MVKTNQDIVGEQYIKHDDGVLAVSDADKKIAWKRYHEKLFNTEFAWNRNSLSQTGTVNGVPGLIGKDMVRESIRKAAHPSGVVSEMVKVAGEAVVGMITGLVNQIIIERVIPAE